MISISWNVNGFGFIYNYGYGSNYFARKELYDLYSFAAVTAIILNISSFGFRYLLERDLFQKNMIHTFFIDNCIAVQKG